MIVRVLHHRTRTYPSGPRGEVIYMANTATQFTVQRNRFKRTYELDAIKQLSDDVAEVIAHPVYKDGKGRPRAIGHLILQKVA